MDIRICAFCGVEFRLARADAKFCSGKCRVYAARRLRGFPPVLVGLDRWVRWDSVKRPLRCDGSPASSTNALSWSSFADVVKSPVGVGVGFVLNGDGLACVDLDHVFVDGVLDARAKEFLLGLDSFWVEVSPSGDGVHAWVWGGSPDGRCVFSLDNGLKVEWYSDSRYLTVTGNRIRL